MLLNLKRSSARNGRMMLITDRDGIGVRQMVVITIESSTRSGSGSASNGVTH